MSKKQWLCVLTGSFAVSPYGELIDVSEPEVPMIIGGVDYLDYYGFTLTPYTVEEEALDMMESDLEEQMKAFAKRHWATDSNNHTVKYQTVVSQSGILGFRIEVMGLVVVQEVKGVLDNNIGFMLGGFIL